MNDSIRVKLKKLLIRKISLKDDLNYKLRLGKRYNFG